MTTITLNLQDGLVLFGLGAAILVFFVTRTFWQKGKKSMSERVARLEKQIKCSHARVCFPDYHLAVLVKECEYCGLRLKNYGGDHHGWTKDKAIWMRSEAARLEGLAQRTEEPCQRNGLGC